MTACTSKPHCPCSFCVQARTGESPKDEQDRIAVEYMRGLEAKAARIRAQRRAKQIRYAAQRRNQPIVHNARGRLCSACWDYENKERKK